MKTSLPRLTEPTIEFGKGKLISDTGMFELTQATSSNRCLLNLFSRPLLSLFVFFPVGLGAEPAPPLEPLNEQANPFGGQLAAEYEKVDPEKDGWNTEAFYETANLQLKKLASLLNSAQGVTADSLEPFVVGADCPATNLRPKQLRTVFAEGATSVKRSDQSGIEHGAVPLDKALTEFLLPLKTLQFDAYFKVYRVHTESKNRVHTSVLVTTFGTSSNDSRAVQQNAEWSVAWDNSGEFPLILSVSGLRYEEIESPTPGRTLTSDCAASVLGENASYKKLLLPSLDHWAGTLHNQLGIETVGYNGLSLGDVNGDLLPDLYLCQSGGIPNQLFIQNENGTLRDASSESGTNLLERSRSSCLIDIDNDGDQDLAVLSLSHLLLMENLGKGNFVRKTKIKLPGTPFSMAAADYDNDADLDFYVCNYGDLWGGFGDLNERFPIPYHDANNGGPNVLLRNDGHWNFTDATHENGMDVNNRRWSLSCAWEDFDCDGDVDLYVANDFGRNNLFRNDGGTFIDIAPGAGVEDISPGMSASWGDYDGDGFMDIYVSNMFSGAGNRVTFQDKFKSGADETTLGHYRRFARGNALFRNNGDGTFRDVSLAARVSIGRWAWASQFVDLNNDGREDIAVANGFLTQQDSRDL